MVDGDPRHRRRALVGDELEVIGLAADDAADRDQRVVLVGIGKRVEGDADLERARHLQVSDVGDQDAEAEQLVNASAREQIGELGVEAGLDDADAQLAAVKARRLAAFSVAHEPRRPSARPARRRDSL